MSQPNILSGSIAPQDWTTIASSIVQQIPWQQIFSSFQSQPMLAGRSGLGTYGVSPLANGYGNVGTGYGTAGAPGYGVGAGGFGMPQGQVTPQDWTSLIGPVLQTSLPIIFSLLQAQPQLRQQSVSPFASGYGLSGAPGQLHPQDWTNLVGTVIQQVPWQQIFSMFQAQPYLRPQGMTPGVPGYGGFGVSQGHLAPQDWTNLIGPVLQTSLPIIFSLLQAQPSLAGRGGSPYPYSLGA
jgi:hypothetical protein